MQHCQKLSLVAMVTVAIGTIIIPKMQASSVAFQSISRIHMKGYIRMSFGHDLKYMCYFLQFLPFDLGLSDLDLGQGHSNVIYM